MNVYLDSLNLNHNNNLVVIAILIKSIKANEENYISEEVVLTNRGTRLLKRVKDYIKNKKVKSKCVE